MLSLYIYEFTYTPRNVPCQALATRKGEGQIFMIINPGNTRSYGKTLKSTFFLSIHDEDDELCIFD